MTDTVVGLGPGGFMAWSARFQPLGRSRTPLVAKDVRPGARSKRLPFQQTHHEGKVV